MSADSVKIYEEAEQNNIKLIQNIRKFVIIGLISCYLPSLLVPISYLVIRFPEPDLWILPFPVNFIQFHIFRFFFVKHLDLQGGIANPHKFGGYYMSWIVQFGGGFVYMVIFGIVLAMEIGFCQFISVCSNDLREICVKINKSDLKNSKSSRNMLKEGIQLHEEILK